MDVGNTFEEPRTWEGGSKLFVLVGLHVTTLGKEEELGIVWAFPNELLHGNQSC